MSHNFRRRPTASETLPYLVRAHVSEILCKLQKPLLAHRRAAVSRPGNANEPFRCSQDFAAGRRAWQRTQFCPGVVVRTRGQENVDKKVQSSVVTDQRCCLRQGIADQAGVPLPEGMVERSESRGKIVAVPPVNCPMDWRERTYSHRKRTHTAMGMVSRTYGGIRPSVVGKDQPPLPITDRPPLFPEISQVRAGFVIALVEMPRLQESGESEKQGFSAHRSRPRQTRPLCNEQKRNFVVLEPHSRRDGLKEGLTPPAKLGCAPEDFALSMKTKRRPGLDQFRCLRFINRSIPRWFGVLRHPPQRETNLNDGLVFARSRKATALSPANEEVKDDVFVRGVPGMSVVFPVPNVLIDLDVPRDFHSIDKHLSAAEVWAWLTVPNSKMDDFHFLSVLAQPRNAKLSTENSCLQLQLGDATGSGLAQSQSSQLATELLIPRFFGLFHFWTGGVARSRSSNELII